MHAGEDSFLPCYHLLITSHAVIEFDVKPSNAVNWLSTACLRSLAPFPLLSSYSCSVGTSVYIWKSSMEKSLSFAQFAHRQATALRACAACHLWFPYGALCHKQVLPRRFCSSCVFRSFYFSSRRWNFTYSTRLSRLHTQAGKGGESTRLVRDGDERITKEKFEGGDRIRSEHNVRILKEGRTDTNSIAAPGNDAGTSSNVPPFTGDENVTTGTAFSRVAQEEDTCSSNVRRNHRPDVRGGPQAGFDEPETDLVRQVEGKIEGRNGASSENGGEKEQAFRIDVQMTPNPLARKFLVEGASLLPPSADSLSSKSFSKRDKYDHIPLVKSLFEISNFTSILVAKEYLTVVKKKADAWEDLEQKIRTCLLKHLKAGDLPLYGVAASSDAGTPERSLSAQQQQHDPQERTAAGAEAAASESDNGSASNHEGGNAAALTSADSALGDSSTKNNEDDEEVAEAIKSLLYLRARPMLLADGGDLEMIRFDADTGVVWVYLKGSCQGCPSSLITVKRGMKQMLQYYIPEVEDVRQCDENGDPLQEDDDE